MPKFIQYNINAIQPILSEFIDKLEFDREYLEKEILELYNECKNYETKKTKKGFFSILKRILFLDSNEKNLKIRLNPLGALLKKNFQNTKLQKEAIFLDLFDNTDIFKKECIILSDYLDRKGNIAKSKEGFKDFLCLKIEHVLKNDENFKDNLENAKNKISLTVQNLIQLGAIQEKNDMIILNNYHIEWKLFIFLLTQELNRKKITFEQINNSEFRKKFFLKIEDIFEYLKKLQLENLILIENRAGLSQIDLKYTNIFDLVKNIF